MTKASSPGSSATCTPSDDAYQNYPFQLSSYNPLTEWGTHYEQIFKWDLWPAQSNFDVIDVNNGRVERRRISGNKSITGLLNEDPDLRIFFCDSAVCSDGVTRASFASEDLKMIFSKYDFSIIFLDRFVGRNRPTIGSRKLHNPETNELVSYDLWYDLPARIYTDQSDYDYHFILFTAYIHYDCRTKKTVIFYIHRQGSENHAFARLSSEKVKDRIASALEHTLSADAAKFGLLGGPFAAQMPTITCSVIFWTETLHKERLSMWAKEDEARANMEMVDTTWLHNVVRYLHSYKTNISVLKRTLELVKSEHEWFADNIGLAQNYSRWHPSYSTIADTIDSQIFQMTTIDIFSDEVINRTQNLLSIYFSRVSEIDSRATANIAVETRRDAISMRTIASVTLIFLPATFVSAFFGMHFFEEQNSKGSILSSKQLWLYPVITIPLTILVIGVWWLWLTSKRKHSDRAWEEEWKHVQLVKGEKAV